MYSLNIKGYIPQSKWKEFKQHMRQLAGQQNEDMIKISVLQDTINEDLFEVKVEFKDKQDMFSFIKTEQYTMISGSFRALGMLRDKYLIECSTVKTKNEHE